MSIDKGPTEVNRLVSAGYVKTVASGYIFTAQGLEFLVTSIQELYNEIRTIKFPSDNAGPQCPDDLTVSGNTNGDTEDPE